MPDAQGDVILTHRHGDHVGSLPAVLGLATEATAYAGAPDVPSIESPRGAQAVADGDLVFGMQIVTTPGHTEGHIAVLDPAGSLLVAGDALNGADGGGVAGPNPQFTPAMDQAVASVRKLAALEFDLSRLARLPTRAGRSPARVVTGRGMWRQRSRENFRATPRTGGIETWAGSWSAGDPRPRWPMEFTPMETIQMT